MDAVPCHSCLIPLYCSQLCQVQAGGDKVYDTSKNVYIFDNFSDDLEKYISDIISVKLSSSCSKNFTEHSHECQGAHWPLVLPPEIVLAGRVLVKHIEQQRHSNLSFSLLGLWVFSHSCFLLLFYNLFFKASYHGSFDLVFLGSLSQLCSTPFRK